MSESDEQRNLVSVLSSVHATLQVSKRRTQSDEDWQKTWEAHTSNFEVLKEYSKAMHDLASKIWNPKNTSQKSNTEQHVLDPERSNKSRKLKCRLEWVVDRCKDYFQNTDASTSVVTDKKTHVLHRKLKLLDVGSCYNPFSKYKSVFDIVAIDLCPAPGLEQDIFQCDFLKLNVVESSSNEILNENRTGMYKTLKNLSTCSFDVVVFSFLLEYLADSKQRLECCKKAFELLSVGGLLFILRPDSNKDTGRGHSNFLRKLKVGLAVLGFKRVYFEKLEHLWCMAFKKLDMDDKLLYLQSGYFKKDVDKSDVLFAVEDKARLHELFLIPQDLKNDYDHIAHSTVGLSNSEIVENECPEKLLEELPFFR